MGPQWLIRQSSRLPSWRPGFDSRYLPMQKIKIRCRSAKDYLGSLEWPARWMDTWCVGDSYKGLNHSRNGDRIALERHENKCQLKLETARMLWIFYTLIRYIEISWLPVYCYLWSDFICNAIALVLYQQVRMERLTKKLKLERKKLDQLKAEVNGVEQDLILRRLRRVSCTTSISKVSEF